MLDATTAAPAIPVREGEFPGLCGPYAVLGAAHALLGRPEPADNESLFKAILRSPSTARYPDLLLDGATFGDVRRMLAAVAAWDKGRRPERKIVPMMPFGSGAGQVEAPDEIEAFWARLDARLHQNEAAESQVTVFGLSEPALRWCAMGPGEEIRMADAAGGLRTLTRADFRLAREEGEAGHRIVARETSILVLLKEDETRLRRVPKPTGPFGRGGAR